MSSDSLAAVLFIGGGDSGDGVLSKLFSPS
jgi:hypothetical protein